MNRLYDRIGRLGATVLLLVIALGLVWWGYSSWASGKAAKVENKLNRETTGAVLDSVDVANETAANVNRRADELDAQTKELADEILDAPPTERNAAARRAVCGMRIYRDHPDCAGVRAADPAKPAGADPAR